LLDPISYETAKNASIAAAEGGVSRCANAVTTEDDFYYYSDDNQKLYYVDDYYYYNGFAGEDASESQSISIARRHTKHKIVHKVPTYAYAAAVAVLASFVACIVLYCRWKREKSRAMLNGSLVRFTQLPTDDDDAVFENTAVGDADVNPFRSDGTSRLDRYGSL
jgi:hypothetical protein